MIQTFKDSRILALDESLWNEGAVVGKSYKSFKCVL